VQIGIPVPFSFSAKRPLCITIARKRKSLAQEPTRPPKIFAHIYVDLTPIQPNSELVGFYPLIDHQTRTQLGSSRAKLKFEYVTNGPWSTETAGRLYLKPSPQTFLHFKIKFPRNKMQLHQSLPIRVIVRDQRNNLTDDLQSGEIECQVINPGMVPYYVRAHKDFPAASEGHFQIDFDPSELGRHRLMVMYNDHDVQKEPFYVTVVPTNFDEAS
jgi:hypothetical protein